MKKLVFVCTLLGVSNFGTVETYGMNHQEENVADQGNPVGEIGLQLTDDNESDDLDPYATMYRNTTGRLTEAELVAFTNATISALCTLGSVLIMGGKLYFTNFEDDIDTGNRINTMINQILIFTGIGISANVALRCLRPNMADHNRIHNCILLYLLAATTYAVLSESPCALTTEATLDDIGQFLSAQNMYGFAALGGFFLGEALYCR